MLVPLKWLREMVAFDLSPQELADLLTNSGLEVDGVIERHGGLDKVITAKLLEVNPTPTPTACAWPRWTAAAAAPRRWYAARPTSPWA